MSIWFPYLTTDWLTRQQPFLSGKPFVFVTADRGRKLISALNTAARQTGITKGMALSDARILAPTLDYRDEQPHLEETLLRKAGLWCMRYTPVSALDAPDGLILDISGCTHLWGRESAYFKEIVLKLKAKGRTKPYTSIREIQRSGVTLATLEKLANADAFRSLGLDRRQALWEIKGLSGSVTTRYRDRSGKLNIAHQPGLFDCLPANEEPSRLPEMTTGEQVVEDYASLALSLKAHPISLIREKLKRLNCLTAADLAHYKNGDYVQVAGLVLSRQRPATAKGTCFITIEDETATANLIVWASVFEVYKKEITGAKLIIAAGNVQIEKCVIHLVTQQVYNMTPLLSVLATVQPTETPLTTLSRANENSAAPFVDPYQQQAQQKDPDKHFPKGRNFR